MSSKKSVIKRVLLGGVGLVVLSLVLLTWQRLRKNEVRDKEMATLPNIELAQLDGSPFDINSLQKGIPTIFILFNSECSHCEDEALLLREHKEVFEQVNLLWVSEEEADKISAFAQKYQLQEWPHSYMLKSEEDVFFDTFGLSTTPSLVVYDADNSLQGKLKGVSSIDKLRALLK